MSTHRATRDFGIYVRARIGGGSTTKKFKKGQDIPRDLVLQCPPSAIEEVKPTVSSETKNPETKDHKKPGNI